MEKLILSFNVVLLLCLFYNIYTTDMTMAYNPGFVALAVLLVVLTTVFSIVTMFIFVLKQRGLV